MNWILFIDSTEAGFGTILSIILFAGSIGYGAYMASRRKEQEPVVDEQLTPVSSQGAYTPYVLGRQRVTPVFGWAGNRDLKQRAPDGQKAFNAGSNSELTIYEEWGWHILGPGPMYALHKVWESGKLIYDGPPIERPLDGSPTLLQIDNNNIAYIYWGTDDQPVNEDLAGHLGISTGWPHIAYIFWKPKRLGMSNTWPVLDYEVEFRPEGSQLTGDIWMEMSRTLSPNSYKVWTVHNGAPGINYLIVRNDRRSEFKNETKATISGQTTNPSVNGDYEVHSTEYDDKDIERDDISYVLDTWDVINPSNTTVVNTGGYWRIDLGSSLQEGGISHDAEEFLEIVPGNENLQVFKFDVRDQATTTPFQIKVGFYNVTNPARSAWAILSFDGSAGVPTITNDGCTRIDINPTTNRVSVYVQVGNNAKPFPGDTRQLRFYYPAQASGAGVRFHITKGQTIMRESRGTKVFLDTTFASNQLRNREGSLAPWVIDNWDGANPAHVLDQLLFAKFPQGLGLDRDRYFNTDSLQTLVASFGDAGERLISHITALRGEKASGVLERILTDLGVALSHHTDDGKLHFDLIRKPDTAVPELGEDMVIEPLPEIETFHGALPFDAVAFSFKNRERAYRETPIFLDESGQASITERDNTQIVPLSLVTDVEAAQKVALRREPEELSTPTRLKIYANRAARNLSPGAFLSIPSVADETLRLLSVSADPTRSKVELECVVDTYGVDLLDYGLDLGLPPGNTPQPPAADPLSRFWEMPRYLTGSTPQLAFLRCRANSLVIRASQWLSQDNSTYINVGADYTVQAAGTLAEALSVDSERLIEEGPEVTLLGVPDIDAIEDLTGDELSWLSGRQLVLLVDSSGNTEVCYLRAVEVTTTNTVRLLGLVRARYDTEKLDLAIDAQAFIFQNNVIKRSSYLMLPDQELFHKSQPASSWAVSLADVTAFSQVLAGKWITPLKPAFFATDTGIPYYAPSGDLVLEWRHRSSAGLVYRTGMGFQTYGEPVGSSGPDGDFELTVTDPSIPTTVEVTITSPAITHTLTNAWIQSNFSGEPAQLDLELRAIEAGRRSPAATLSIVKLTPA